MPFGGNDWLALTPEPPVEPELPICDAHHHFWDLRTERVPYQRYLLHELVADIQSGHNVRATVFIEARAMYRAHGPEEMRPVGEVEFVQGLAAYRKYKAPFHAYTSAGASQHPARASPCHRDHPQRASARGERLARPAGRRPAAVAGRPDGQDGCLVTGSRRGWGC